MKVMTIEEADQELHELRIEWAQENIKQAESDCRTLQQQLQAQPLDDEYPRIARTWKRAETRLKVMKLLLGDADALEGTGLRIFTKGFITTRGRKECSRCTYESAAS